MTLARRRYRFPAEKRRSHPALKAFLLPQRDKQEARVTPPPNATYDFTGRTVRLDERDAA